MAIAALACGIASIPLVLFCFFGLIGGTLGLVFGSIALGRISRSRGALTGRGMAIAGIVCGGIGLGLNVLWLTLLIAVNL